MQTSELLTRLAKYAADPRMENQNMLTFLDDSGAVEASFTCAQLHRRVQQLAWLLVASKQQHPKGLDLKPGDRVLLVFPPGLDFVVAFLACLRVGVVAVPVYPPDPNRMQKDLTMFVAICESCQVQKALTNALYHSAKKLTALQQRFQSLGKMLMGSGSQTLRWPEALQWIVVEDLLVDKELSAAATESMKGFAPKASDVAFLQYTSGSTSVPKGVMLTHGNLNHNLKTISSVLKAGKDTVVVSWLPQYHDMGLIGAYLGLIFNGGKGYYMSPFSFIRRPMLWIEMISKYKATHLQAPNFAYSLCARKANDLKSHANQKIDLTSVRHMINGAEPITSAAMDAFYRAFEPYGLGNNVIKPTFGLAEHTVFVCGNGQLRVFADKRKLEEANEMIEVPNDPKTKNNDKVKEMIGCGKPSVKDYGIDVRIVNGETGEQLGEGKVGEIWIASESKALGYFQMKELSQEAFHAKLKTKDSKDSSKEFLRTGDMGVMYRGELFICGRIKDLLIIRGRNHYPQDLEQTAESNHQEIRPGCVAAFCVNHAVTNEEQLVVLAEIRDENLTNKASLCQAIRGEIAQQHGVQVHMVVLIKQRTIIKTTSGKISRAKCKKAFEENQLQEIYRNEDMIAMDAVDRGEDTAADQAATATTSGTNHLAMRSQPTEDDVQIARGIQESNFSPQNVLSILKHEAAVLLDVDGNMIRTTAPLQQMGMDSMALTQFQGIISQRFHKKIAEEILFGEHTTLETLQQVICQHEEDPLATANAQTTFLNPQDQVQQQLQQPTATTITTNTSAVTAEEDASPRRKQRLFCGCIAC